MSVSISNEPEVDLSTTSAFFWGEESEPPVDPEEWQLVRVVLAQITPQTYGLTVCPVLDCGLAQLPLTPSLEILVPESSTTVILDETTKRVTIVRLGKKSYLYFDEMLEFWNFGTIIAQLRSNEEERKADALEKLRLIRLFVPAHGPDGLMDLLCHNAEHQHLASHSLLSSPSSSSTVTLT